MDYLDVVDKENPLSLSGTSSSSSGDRAMTSVSQSMWRCDNRLVRSRCLTSTEIRLQREMEVLL
jgi:hypothetical protein